MAQKTAAEIAAEKAEAEKAAAVQAEKDRESQDPALDGAVKATVATEKKRLTRAQKLQADADAAQAEAEAASLVGCETFVVVHPKMNIYVGTDRDEIEISVGTEKTWVDVVDGWAVVPKNTQLRAATGRELADFRMKVNLGFLTAIPAVPAAS